MTIYKTNRWARLAVTTTLLSATVASMSASPVQAVSANPSTVCNNGSCTATFEYSGDYYQYSIPAGARTVSFQAFGAQGGHTGGNGAKISGNLSSIPTTLYIYVGGAGQTGSAKPGGFNGGGAAGSGHGDEGSGGGASDIRLSTALADRIAVAGGGGGTGGWVGGLGGVGGGTIAGNGQPGQGGAGLGGTQLAGGAGGAGSAANSGAAGALSSGGAGGNGSMAGGAGGGGGYYGGGGGGGDGVPSGSDGGGGGGGSSYASIANTTSVSHSAGVRSGNGQVIITYAYAPTLTSFASTSASTNAMNLTFNLGFSQNVFGLDATDFYFTGTSAGCFVNSVSGSGSAYALTVSGCSDGYVMANLAADAVVGATSGPVSISTSASVLVDRTRPNLTITPPASPTNSTSLSFSVTSDEPIVGLSASSFTVAGASCVVGTVTGSSKSYSVAVDSCAATATAALTLKAFAVTDAIGNTGPATALSSSQVSVDRVVPAVTSLIKSNSSRTGMQVYELVMSEPVTGMANDAAHWTVLGAGCSISKLLGSGTSYSIWVAGCNDSVRTSITLKANSLTDAAGNLGPSIDGVSPETQVDDQLPRVVITADARASQSGSPTFTVTFSEVVSGVTVDVFTHSGTVANCKFALTETTTGLVYKVATTGCSAGTIKLGVPAFAIQDVAGNLGPNLPTESPAVIIDVDPGAGVNPSGTSRPLTIAKPSRSLSKSSAVQLASFAPPKRIQSPPAAGLANDANRWLLAAGLPLLASGLLKRRS